ncbi:hypothetical protein [Neptunomonas sp.]|uniref:hypothetical protein n=1 Tax=Neptunomonas sp. TaxID=1971898 RepID=UPI0035653B53
MLMFIRFLFLFLPATLCYAEKIETRGDCSPAIIENESAIKINCYINDLPIDSIIRNGKANDLIDALNSGLSAKTIFQGFVLGDVKNMAGIDFFRNVKLDELEQFLNVISKSINLNNRIYIKDDSYTTMFNLATESERSAVIEALANVGLSIHVDSNLQGGDRTACVTKQFFPIVELVRNGVISLNQTEILEKLFALSFIYPEFNVKVGNTTTLPVQDSSCWGFYESLELRKKIISTLSKIEKRKPYDMSNILEICSYASHADKFDWCNRLKRVSKLYLAEDKSVSNWYPYSIQLIGLYEISSDYAVFFMHHTRGWGGIGFFLVPKKGTIFKVGMWNTSMSNATACWNDRLNGYKTNCWRYYTAEQDLFDQNKMELGGYIYQASEEKIKW